MGVQRILYSVQGQCRMTAQPIYLNIYLQMSTFGCYASTDPQNGWKRDIRFHFAVSSMRQILIFVSSVDGLACCQRQKNIIYFKQTIWTLTMRAWLTLPTCPICAESNCQHTRSVRCTVYASWSMGKYANCHPYICTHILLAKNISLHASIYCRCYRLAKN